MTSPHLYLGAFLLALPPPGVAQTPDAAPAATLRGYVGLAAYHSTFQHLFSGRPGDTGFRVPVQLTAGYRVRPRLALELGLAYSDRTATATGFLIDATGTVSARYTDTRTDRTAAGSAWARYALTRPSAHRLQLEALGGFTLVRTAVHVQTSVTEYPVPGPPSDPYTARRSFNDLLLTAGLGLRYRLSPRCALTFDLTANRNLNHPKTHNGYTGSAALGLRYCFGQG